MLGRRSFFLSPLDSRGPIQKATSFSQLARYIDGIRRFSYAVDISEQLAYPVQQVQVGLSVVFYALLGILCLPFTPLAAYLLLTVAGKLHAQLNAYNLTL